MQHTYPFLKLIVFSLNILFIAETCAQTLFNKRYGTSSFEEATAITPAFDGGFAVVGNTDANGAGGNIFILKLSQQGNIQWQKHIFGVNQDVAKAVYQLSNGNFLVGGYTSSYGSGCWDAFITILDSTGNFILSKTYGDVNCNEAIDLCLTADGGLAGCGASGGSTGYSWIFKVDQNGMPQWSKWYSTGTLYFVAIKQTNDGGYLAASPISVIKTDAAGNPLWSKNYSNIECFNIELLNDGSAVLTGTDAGNIFLLKIDGSGNPLWYKTYGFTFYERGLSVKKTFDSGFVIAGYTNSFGHGDEDAFLLKTDSTGNFQWAKVYGDAWEDRALQVQMLNDSGFVFAGYSYSSTNNDSSYAYVVRTDQNGVVACHYLDWTPIQQTQNSNAGSLIITATDFGVDSSCTVPVLNEFFIERDFCQPLGLENIPEENYIKIYPDPSSGNFIIHFNNNEYSEKTIRIFDAIGNFVYEKNKITSSKVEINLTSSPKGIYFLKVITGDKITVAKILVQ